MILDLIALGKRIQAVRKKKGLSQNELSELIDKTPTYLSYIENGTKCVSLDTFVDIVNSLNTTADDLLKDSLENTVVITNGRFTELLSDCTAYEQRVLLEIAASAKASLRSNKSYFQRH